LFERDLEMVLGVCHYLTRVCSSSKHPSKCNVGLAAAARARH
jgi:hypothetical protein